MNRRREPLVRSPNRRGPAARGCCRPALRSGSRSGLGCGSGHSRCNVGAFAGAD